MKSLVLLEKVPTATVVENSSGVITSGSVTNAEALNPQITDDYYIFGQGGAKNRVARYALKTLGFATRTYRQPLQVGIPRQSPIMFDVGSYRPVLTVSGVVEREPSPEGHHTLFEGNKYYYPTFFQLQHAVTQWNYIEGEEIFLTLLHTNVATVSYEKYNVSIQTSTFGLNSQLPKLWTFELTFVSTRPIAKHPSKNV